MKENTKFSQYSENIPLPFDLLFLLHNLSSFHLVVKMVCRGKEAVL